MYTAEELASYLSFDPVPSSWAHCLEEAENTYRPDWLMQYDWKEILAYYGLDETFSRRFLQEIQTLREDARLNFACWLWHHILYLADVRERMDIWGWDTRKTAFSRHGSPMMAAITFLSGFPCHQKNMEKYHFDSAQKAVQQYGVRYYCTWDRKKHGTDGIRFRQMMFASFLLSGLMTWHGRLQFEYIPEGFAPLAPFIKEGSPVVFVHIPEDGPLDEDAVQRSLETALEKIPGYYQFQPDHPPVFFTQSWLLCPQLAEILPEESRILKFQKHFRLLDSRPFPQDFLYFVFDMDKTPDSLETLPEKTSLQREIKKRLISGAPLDRGLGILQVV